MNSLRDVATYKEIGVKLFITVGIVWHHIKNINGKAEAAVKALNEKQIKYLEFDTN